MIANKSSKAENSYYMSKTSRRAPHEYSEQTITK